MGKIKKVLLIKKIFLSFPRATHARDDSCLPIEEAYVHRVSYFLRKQTDLDVFCYALDGPDDLWEVHVEPHLVKAEVFVLFSLNPELREGSGQWREYVAWKNKVDNEYKVKNSPHLLIIVNLRDTPFNNSYQNHIITKCYTINKTKKRLTINDLDNSEECAQYIYRCIHKKAKKDLWLDGLPIGYPFGYEKQIIDAFAAEGTDPFGENSTQIANRLQLRHPNRLASGSPVKWPSLEESRRRCFFGSPISKEDIGEYRDGKVIIVDPRGTYHQGFNSGTCLKKIGLEIPEAGPRSAVCFPVHDKQKPNKLSVGIVVSGGIAPGINAVLEGIVERHRQYCIGASKKNNFSGKKELKNTPPYELTICIFDHGLIGITEGLQSKIVFDANGNTVSGHDFLERLQSAKSAGGSVISTARYDKILDGKSKRQRKIDEILAKLTDNSDCRVDILYVIGGEGSMRAAHALSYRAQITNKTLSVVGVPKTMDNDILWAWQSFGFLSAVEKAREFFTQLETEVRSNPRLCIMQLFGSDSGFVVSHAALAGGRSCIAALIPEIVFSMTALSKHVKKEFNPLGYGIIVLAETAVPIDVEDYVEDLKIGLNNEEKSAVRKFVGSAMLREDAISSESWPELIKKLLHPDVTLAQQKLVAKTFKTEEVAFLNKLSNRIQDPEKKEESLTVQEKSRVVGIINFAIRSKGDAWLQSFTYGPGSLALFGKPVREAINFVDTYIVNHDKKQTKILPEEMKHLQALATVMSLPYEANAIIWEIDEANQRPSIVLMKQLSKRLKETYARLVAETYLGVPERRWTEHRDRRVFGQTPDELRTAGLKIVSRLLEREIQVKENKNKGKSKKFWSKYKHGVFASEPRHLIRAIGPSCHDVIFGDRMGRLAVDGSMSGYHDFMISQWLTEFVFVPLPLVVLGRKRVPSDGIFWKSVIASTRQPANLWY